MYAMNVFPTQRSTRSPRFRTDGRVQVPCFLVGLALNATIMHVVHSNRLMLNMNVFVNEFFELRSLLERGSRGDDRRRRGPRAHFVRRRAPPTAAFIGPPLAGGAHPTE